MRVGIASPRVVVRQVEMPVMTRDELASALQFQAGDLIPIPIDDAVLDFAILGTVEPRATAASRRCRCCSPRRTKRRSPRSSRRSKPAASRSPPSTSSRSRSSGAGRGRCGARGSRRPASTRRKAPGAEGIVSFGGGVTAIAVHEGGIPRFVRVLGTGGRELTDAIAAELDLPPETAEALKRQLAQRRHADELVARARTVDRTAAVGAARRSPQLDRLLPQPARLGAAAARRRHRRCGAAPRLPDRLSALVGVPVEPATPRSQLAIGDIGFPESEFPRLDPYLPAAVGLALGGAGVGTVIDLCRRVTASARSPTRVVPAVPACSSRSSRSPRD